MERHTLLEESHGRLGVPVLRSDVYEGAAVLRPGGDVGPELVDQGLDDTRVASFRRNMQRGPVHLK